MGKLRRHKAVYSFLRFTLSPLLRRLLRFKGEPVKPDFNCLVLANHNTDWDPLLCATAVKAHMYFVASEHIFRWGLISRIIVHLVDPIARPKGSSALQTIKEIRKRLGLGTNVMMFAEGNRSWNGETGFISPATGKLAKATGCGLITYRLSGGYFASPRWAENRRKGPILGHIAGIYSPEQLKNMSVDEVNRAISQDLYENAYELQQKQMIPYRSKRPAEFLERVLYMCPSCKRLLSLKSSGSNFSCSCGYSVKINDFGFFEAKDGAPVFDNIYDWDMWQKAELFSLADKYSSSGIKDPFICMPDEGLFLIHQKADSVLLARSTMNIYADRLEMVNGDEAYTFLYSSISGMAVNGKGTLVFTADDGKYYELKNTRPRCALLYNILFRHFSGREYI